MCWCWFRACWSTSPPCCSCRWSPEGSCSRCCGGRWRGGGRARWNGSSGRPRAGCGVPSSAREARRGRPRMPVTVRRGGRRGTRVAGRSAKLPPAQRAVVSSSRTLRAGAINDDSILGAQPCRRRRPALPIGWPPPVSSGRWCVRTAPGRAGRQGHRQHRPWVAWRLRTTDRGDGRTTHPGPAVWTSCSATSCPDH
jgi:hypothetical protein